MKRRNGIFDKRKFWAVVTGAAMLSGLMSVCAGAAEAKTEEPFTVGICQYVQHEALDAATEGFKAALQERLGERVIFDEQNAQGDSHTCPIIMNGFIAKEVDLILANATPALQAAVTATSEIPILGTSVTNYAVALSQEDFDGVVGGNVSGTSDLAPLDGQAAMIQELFPDYETVGLLYCSAEPNSQYQIDVMTQELETLGYDCTAYGFLDSNDVSSVVNKAVMESDLIYVPTDNTAAANAELIANICGPAGVPVVTGDEGCCRACGIATLAISYYELGYVTGEMAADILENKADISEMPIQYAPKFTKEYNKAVCEALGMEVPGDYTELEMSGEF